MWRDQHNDAAGGACDAIKFLLTPDSEQGCSLDVTDNEGNTAWHVAAEGGHIKAVQCLLKEGAQLDSTNHAGCTALHIAARSGEPIHCLHLTVMLFLPIAFLPNVTVLVAV